MPTNIKLGVSAMAILVGLLVHLWERSAGNEHLSWVVAGLTAFMVLAMWIFPETGSRKGNIR